jgi:hypothetical protein
VIQYRSHSLMIRFPSVRPALPYSAKPSLGGTKTTPPNG